MFHHRHGLPDGWQGIVESTCAIWPLLSADDGAIPGWLDWAAQHPAEANGGILLMHGRAETVAALPDWLDRLAALGLQPGTLGEALR